jgi:hypothetical protein
LSAASNRASLLTGFEPSDLATRTGADYYVNLPGAGGDDLETAIRLEVSGISDGNLILIESRLKQKLNQAAKGSSNLPALAVVVGFAHLKIVSADLGTP